MHDKEQKDIEYSIHQDLNEKKITTGDENPYLCMNMSFFWALM